MTSKELLIFSILIASAGASPAYSDSAGVSLEYSVQNTAIISESIGVALESSLILDGKDRGEWQIIATELTKLLDRGEWA